MEIYVSQLVSLFWKVIRFRYLVVKFSTSDNAFCVLWLVHSILVISSYTLVWPYIVHDCAKHCWAKNVFAWKRYFSLKKSQKRKKNFFVESLDQCQCLEVPEKVRNVFCDEPTSVWPQGVAQHRIFIKFFFYFAWIFSLFSARISYFKFLELKEFNKTIILFALVGYETGYSQLGATRLLAIYHLISNARSWNNC